MEEQPKLLQGLEFYWNAYFDLKYDRPMGMDFGPIPWSSIVRWCELYGVTDLDEIEKLKRYIRAMEGVDVEQKDTKKNG